MRPSDVFDKVLLRVREYQALQGRIPAVRVDSEINGGPSRVGDTATEYIAEFVLSGRRALRQWPKRVEVFELYYAQNLPRPVVLKVLKLQEGTLNYWTLEIKKAVGRELSRRGLYPPSKYTRRYLPEQEDMHGATTGEV